MGSLGSVKSGEFFVVLLLLVVPGLLIDFVRSQFIVRRTRTIAETTLVFVVISLIYYALVVPIAVWAAESIDALISKIWAWYLLVLVGPLAMGMLLGFLAQLNLFGRVVRHFGFTIRHPMPTAWDQKFSDYRTQFVIVTLKDGRTIAGWLGRDSVASSEHNDRDLFVERVYRLGDDGEFIDLNGRSALIMGGEISTLEFIDALEGDADGEVGE